MTLVIAVPGKDFVVLGADSRGVIEVGSGRADLNNCQKIIQITKYVSFLMFGASEEGNQLVEKYKAQIDPAIEDVKSVAEDFCKFCQEEERSLMDVPMTDSVSNFGFLVCGLRIKDGQVTPMLYTLRNGNGFRLGLCKPYAIKGKPMIAHYLFSKDFKDEMTVDEACKLVAQSIYDTMQIDGDVGGPIRITVIDSEGTRNIQDSDVQDYVETWTLRNLQKVMY